MDGYDGDAISENEWDEADRQYAEWDDDWEPNEEDIILDFDD